MGKGVLAAVISVVLFGIVMIGFTVWISDRGETSSDYWFWVILGLDIGLIPAGLLCWIPLWIDFRRDMRKHRI